MLMKGYYRSVRLDFFCFVALLCPADVYYGTRYLVRYYNYSSSVTTDKLKVSDDRGREEIRVVASKVPTHHKYGWLG